MGSRFLNAPADDDQTEGSNSGGQRWTAAAATRRQQRQVWGRQGHRARPIDGGCGGRHRHDAGRRRPRLKGRAAVDARESKMPPRRGGGGGQRLAWRRGGWTPSAAAEGRGQPAIDQPAIDQGCRRWSPPLFHQKGVGRPRSREKRNTHTHTHTNATLAAVPATRPTARATAARFSPRRGERASARRAVAPPAPPLGLSGSHRGSSPTQGTHPGTGQSQWRSVAWRGGATRRAPRAAQRRRAPLAVGATAKERQPPGDPAALPIRQQKKKTRKKRRHATYTHTHAATGGGRSVSRRHTHTTCEAGRGGQRR